MCYRQSLGSPTSFMQYGPCLCLLSSTTPLSTVQTPVQCNDISTRSYENQSVVFCTQNCIKACQNYFKVTPYDENIDFVLFYIFIDLYRGARDLSISANIF